MALHPSQKKIISDRHRFRTLVCGRKFGKTTLAAEEIAWCAMTKKDARILYIAPTLDDARRLMWDRIKKKLEGATNKSNDARLELRVKLPQGGYSDIFLGSWEKVQNYRGDEYDLILPDEVQDYRNFWTGWHEALRPTLTPRGGAALLMGTPKGFNHLYDLFQNQNKDADYISFKFSTFDNPFIPVAEIEKARQELSEDRFAQEYLADFRKTEGLVYKEFERQRHIYSVMPEVRVVNKILAIDPGHTNPCAMLLIKEDYDGDLWVDAEHYKTGMITTEIVFRAKLFSPNIVRPDPENAELVDALERAGLAVETVHKGPGSIAAGIDLVKAKFKQGRLHINFSCINLINELETYHYPDSKDGHNPSENPIKENDHALDALRYAVMGQEIVGVGKPVTFYKNTQENVYSGL